MLWWVVFGIVAFWLIRLNMTAIDRRSRAVESFARSRGLSFSAADPFDLATLPFEILAVRGGVAISNVVSGVHEGVPMIAFDLRHQVAVGRPSTMQFSCVVATVPLDGPPIVITRRTAGGRSLEAVVGGAAGIVTESVQFDRDFVVRCDDRRFALATLEPEVMAWLQDARGDWSFELAGARLLCYSPLRGTGELAALLDALVSFRRRIPRLAGEHAAAAPRDALFSGVGEEGAPRPRRPARVSSVVVASVAVVAVAVAALATVAVAALLLGSTSLP